MRLTSGSGRWDIRNGGIPGEILDLGGFKLTKVGGNQVSLVNVNSTAGDIDINAGTFSVEAGSAVQGPGTITLNPGGQLGLWVNEPGKLTRNIIANGGGITELGSNALTTVDSSVAMLADLSYNVINANTVLMQMGDLVESGAPRVLNVSGAGRLVLMGNNVWTGGTNVNGGILQVGNGTASGTSSRASAASARVAAIFISSLIARARTSSAPRKMNGKPRTLLT